VSMVDGFTRLMFAFEDVGATRLAFLFFGLLLTFAGFGMVIQLLAVGLNSFFVPLIDLAFEQDYKLFLLLGSATFFGCAYLFICFTGFAYSFLAKPTLNFLLQKIFHPPVEG
jgi:hypothetical protein